MLRNLRGPGTATLVVLTGLLAACGSSTSSSTVSGGGGSVGTTPDPAIKVPSAIASKGTLVVATDASYAPNEFIDADGKTIIGMDADLAAALAQVTGLKVQMENVKFDSILLGIQSGKYDLGMSSFTDNKTREQSVDMVTYFTAGTLFFTNANGGPQISGLDDLCGHHVAVESGTTQQDDSTAQNTKCTSAGKPGVDVQVYPDQNGANLALTSHRADIVMVDAPVARYQVKISNGQFALTGKEYGQAPYGIAVPKGNGMAQVLLAGLKDLIASGSYQSILKKWTIEAGAIANPQIDGATG